MYIYHVLYFCFVSPFGAWGGTAGHDVVRLNHVGDWGTQFGMLIHYLEVTRTAVVTDGSTNSALEVKDLVAFYRSAKQRFDEDAEFREASRQKVVALQSGDPDTTAAWKAICEVSRGEVKTNEYRNHQKS